MSQVQTFARNKAGELVVNPRKLDCQWFQLVPDPGQAVVGVPVGGQLSAGHGGVVLAAAVASGPVLYTISQDGPCELFYATHYRQDTSGGGAGNENYQNHFVEIYDEGAKRLLMNREIHIDCLMGKTINAPVGTTGIGPHMFAESLFIHASRALQVRLRNGNAAPGVQVAFWPTFHGTRWYGYANPSKELAIAVEKRAARSRLSTPFWYTTDIDFFDAVNPNLAAGANRDRFITIDSSAHFECWKVTYVSAVNVLVEITDMRNGRNFSNGPVFCRAGMGTASFPFILPEHTMVQANGQLRVRVTNMSAGAYNNFAFFITLCGRRIYVA